MPIEFSCPHCQHLLRTAEDKAGLSAKCPACGEAIWVPYARDVAPPSAPPPVPDDPLGTPATPLAASAPTDAATGGRSALQDDDAEEDIFESPPPRPRLPPAEVTCPGCQATNPALASACRYCGTPLEGAKPVSTEQEWTPQPLDVGETISTTWQIYSQRLGLLIGACFVSALLGIPVLFVCAIPMLLAMGVFGAIDEDLVPVGAVLGGLVSVPLLLCAGGALMVGATYLHLNIAAGRPADIGDLLHGFKQGRGLAPGMFVISLVLGLGSMLLAGLGFVLLWPLPYHHVAGRTGLGETFNGFFQLLSKDLAFVLLNGLVVFGIIMVTNTLCYFCVGIVLIWFTAPFVSLLQAVAYLRLTGQKTTLD